MMRFASLALLVLGVAVSQVGAEEQTARFEYRLTILSRQLGHFGLVEMDIDGHRPVRLKNGWFFESPTWSPDGTQVAFSMDVDGRRQIHVMDPDGANIRQLTDSVHSCHTPAWSPDGKQIAFVSQIGPEFKDQRLFVMDADGGNPVNLGEFAEGSEQHNMPTWTPDGRQITFAARLQNTGRLLTMTTDGSQVRTLGSRPVFERGGSSWSPDGKLIVYAAGAGDGTIQLFVSDADARTTRQITTEGTRNWLPAWSPDGRHIAYVSYTTVEGGHHHCFVFDVLHETHTRVCKDALYGNARSRPAWRPFPPGDDK